MSVNARNCIVLPFLPKEDVVAAFKAIENAPSRVLVGDCVRLYEAVLATRNEVRYESVSLSPDIEANRAKRNGNSRGRPTLLLWTYSACFDGASRTDVLYVVHHKQRWRSKAPSDQSSSRELPSDSIWCRPFSQPSRVIAVLRRRHWPFSSLIQPRIFWARFRNKQYDPLYSPV